jgi:PAS domain S-box-containing protein
MGDQHPPNPPSNLPTDEDLRDFFEHAATPFHWMNVDGIIMAANHADLDLMGYQSGEYIGHNIAEFHVEQDVIQDVLRNLAAGEVVPKYAARIRCKDGTVKDVLVDLSVLRRDGTIVYARCFTTDVTDRKEAEDALAQLAAIVASSDDAIVSKDLNGIIRTWNPGAERLFGYTADQMIGRSIRTIIPEEQQDEEDEVLRRIRSGRRVDHFETIRQRSDGSLVPISITVSPVRDRYGRIVGASKIARDITARREAERVMRESMAVKDQFLGLVSHELRTPISTIVGNGQLLLRRGDRLPEPARQQALTDIVSEGERFQGIVENLLVLTRLRAEAAPPRVPVDLSAVAEEVVSVMRRRTHRSVSLTVAEALPIASGDPTAVVIVLQNLLSNADKYSPATATIEVLLAPDADHRPVVRVLDHGIGVQPDDADRVFEPFFRSETAKLNAPGMGLGLAVCRQVVEALGGSIRVEPRPEGGSDFSFSLPAYAPIAPEA